VTYAKARFGNVYPGIDLVYYGNQRQLEYDYIVAPGADPKRIRLGFEGAERLRIDEQGDIVAETAAGEVRWLKPVVYQEVAGSRKEVAGGYALHDGNEVTFQIAKYDATKPLIIDPTLAYSTYLGGTGQELADGGEDGPGIAVDSTGHAFVAGTTYSTDFPAKGFKSGDVGYVAEFNPVGSALVYATYFGPDAFVASIAVDKNGNAYIAGEAHVDTPGTVFGDGADGPFVAKFNTAGALVYTALLGGGGAGHAVAVDLLGNAYATGHVAKNGFPATAGAFQKSLANPQDNATTDGFVAKINPTGSKLVYATFLGGAGFDDCNAIAVDKNFNAYVTGVTNSPNFPTTAGAFQTSLGVCTNLTNAFVTELNPTGSGLVYSTFLGSGLNNARAVHTATLLPSGKVLAAGGHNSCDFLASAELYDSASGTWTATGSLKIERQYHTATLLPNGKVLVAGSNGANDASAELYGPASRSWSATGSLNNGRYSHTATLLRNGKVLVAGGLTNDNSPPYLASAELYDPASGTWTATGSLSTTRYNHTATLLPNGKVLVAGGIGSDPAGAELYDPASGTWTATGNLNTGRYVHTATLLQNGKVLVAGGISATSSGLSASAELYDPASGTWTATGSLKTARDDHTATLLPSGNVLVAAGIGSSGVSPSTELYDPASGTWSVTGSLNSKRYQHTATLLQNGKVLAVGGYQDTNDNVIASAELYDPASKTWTDTGKLGYNRGFTQGFGIAVNGSGEAHVAGRTDSTDFPLTNGAFDTVFAGSVEGFVTSLSADGTALVYSTFLGGTVGTGSTDYNECHGIALDSMGDAYITGVTSSIDFPIKNAFQQSIGDNSPGNGDAFVTELNPSGSALIYSSYLGGTESDNGNAIALDPTGAAYVAGGTGSTNFPTTPGVFQSKNAGGADNFVTKINAPSGTVGNISTRLSVGTGDKVLIGGFIITGTEQKKVIIRGIGPSLSGVGITLADPTLELHQGSTTLATNDNWKINAQTGQSQEAEIRATTIPPKNDLESALVATLSPGAYTAILAGKNGGTGVGVVEVYDLAQAANSRLANISTRGFVDTGNNVMIGGLIVVGGNGTGPTRMMVRALGPSVPVADALADPTLELHNGSGTTIATNDNWKTRPDGTSQQAEIQATTIPPTKDLESALVATLAPGNYTAIVRGKNNTTGVGLVEVYNLQ
jgi:hypothetical protein